MYDLKQRVERVAKELGCSTPEQVDSVWNKMQFWPVPLNPKSLVQQVAGAMEQLKIEVDIHKTNDVYSWL